MDNGQFDLVLTDIHMPGMDGIEATMAIRANETRYGRPRTPIVALTADALETGRRACLEAGMDGFLTKPVDPNELDEMFIFSFSRRHAQRGRMNAPARTSATFAAYLKPRTLVMLTLGFACGLPFLLVGNTFGYWLRDEGTTLTAIGFLSWVGIAYSLKFLWAPIIDRVNAPIFGILGLRRGWMALAQIIVGAAVRDGRLGTGQGLRALGAFALVTAFAARRRISSSTRGESSPRRPRRTRPPLLRLSVRLSRRAARHRCAHPCDRRKSSWAFPMDFMAR